MHSLVLQVIRKRDKVCFIQGCREDHCMTDDVSIDPFSNTKCANTRDVRLCLECFGHSRALKVNTILVDTLCTVCGETLGLESGGTEEIEDTRECPRESKDYRAS